MATVGDALTVKLKGLEVAEQLLPFVYPTVTLWDPSVFHCIVTVLSVDVPPAVVVPPVDLLQT